MTNKIFDIDYQSELTLKRDGGLYFVTEYTEDYCEQISAWRIKCISVQNYWDNNLYGIPIEKEIFYERDFQEYDHFYQFNLPPRKPSERTSIINERIENILKAPLKLDELLNDKYNWHRGIYKEELIRNLLTDLLLEDLRDNINIKVGTGFILTNPKNHSRQIDIIIYMDSSDKIFKCESFVVVPPDSVVAVIEIKSKIDSRQMLGYGKATGALYNQFDVSAFDNNVDRHIIKCIIGFEKGFEKNETFHNWITQFYNKKEIDKINVFKTFPNLIGTLDGFCVHFGIQSKPSFFYSDSPEGISGFQVFYLTLLGELKKLVHLDISNLGEYLNMLPDEKYRDDNPLGINWEGKIIYSG